MLTGSIVALVTPMDETGEIDFIALKELVEFHIKSKTAAIVAMGTTGESATVSVDDHVKVVERIISFSAGRIPVIAGNGANSTSDAIALSKLFTNSGIVAGLNVTPYYNKPTQEGLFQHFKAIAESSELPQILYNVPGRTAVDMLPETVARLADIPNIIGIKEATGDLDRLAQLKAILPADFALYSGDDESAKAIDTQLLPVHTNLFLEANPIPVKWACAELGLIPTANLRLPLTMLSEQYRQSVRDALIESKLL